MTSTRLIARARQAAAQLGITTEEYLAHRLAGERWNPHLRRWQWRTQQRHDGPAIAAGKLGLPVEFYRQQLALGRSWCSGCQDFHPEAAFPKDRRSPNGRYRYCRFHMARQHARRQGHTGVCREGRWDCVVRWGGHSHRHCACGQPIAVSARACGACEARKLRFAA
jgi:hypothetical protein